MRKITAYIAIFTLIFPVYLYSDENSGSVCVGPVPKSNESAMSLQNPTGGGRDFNFSIQIDKGGIKKIRSNINTLISGLDTNNKHLITLRNSRKITQSFWFGFPDYKTTSLCLWFNPLYESWSLQKLKHHNDKCRSCPG